MKKLHNLITIKEITMLRAFIIACPIVCWDTSETSEVWKKKLGRGIYVRQHYSLTGLEYCMLPFTCYRLHVCVRQYYSLTGLEYCMLPFTCYRLHVYVRQYYSLSGLEYCMLPFTCWYNERERSEDVMFTLTPCTGPVVICCVFQKITCLSRFLG
jgi:hypothetical protein